MSIEMKKTENEFEIRVDPNTFHGEWLKHKPIGHSEEMAMKLFKKERRKNELPVFACMAIDPSIVNGQIVYGKGMIPAVGYNYPFWKRVLREYDPTRNSRMMSKTEYVYRNMLIVQQLYENGWSVEDSWKAVFRDSKKVGVFRHSIEGKSEMQPTGSYKIGDFYDLGNTRKLLTRDFYQNRPKVEKIYIGGGCYDNLSGLHPVGLVQEFALVNTELFVAVGMLALDA